jgi:eukaryotic-like serine/threonine-protein kinase
VITVHDVGSFADRVFVAMEYVEGITLRRWLASPRSAREILRVFVAAGRGLGAAHEAGLVHRDFKPDNVIVAGPPGSSPKIVDVPHRVLVLDFGLARAPDGEPSGPDAAEMFEETTESSMLSLTMSGFVVGTPLYMAPEQHSGRAVPASDQFGFCVALYDALFNEMPFKGDSVDELAKRKFETRERRFPRGSSVSRSVRAVLTRGLAAEPTRRFPSMDALCDALEAEPRAATRRVVAVGGLVGVTALLAAAMPGLGGVDDTKCAAVDDALAGIWDPARRVEVERALAATATEWAPETAATVVASLDGYAARLLSAQRAVCEALQVDAAMDPAVIDRELECLQRRKQDLAAMVDVLATADASVGERAVDAVASLPTTATCDGLTAALPEDSGTRARIAVAQERASRIAALTGSGRYDDAQSEVIALLDDAHAIGHAPLVAEAEYLHAEVLHRLGEDEAAVAAYTRAIEAAEGAHADELAARASIGLLFVTGHSLAQHDLAVGHARHAEAAVRRAGSPPALEAELLSTEGTIAHGRGDYEAAKDLLERAVAMREGLGDDAIDGSTMVNLGRTVAALGELAQARAIVERALGLIEHRYGPRHPIVAKTLTHLGALEFEAGDYSAAKGRYERALAIQEASLGPRHPEVAFSLNNVGNALATERKLAEAVPYYERARDILREKLGADHPNVAKLTFNMAELAKHTKDMRRAEVEYRAAAAAFEQAFGHEHPDVGRALNNLASVQYDVGNYGDALRNYSESLRVCEATLGVDHVHLGYPLTGIGLVQLADGRPHEAIAPLERSLALRDKDDIDPMDRADTQFALARALWDGGGDRARARELAIDAIANYGRAEPGYPTARVDAADWLEAHPAR